MGRRSQARLIGLGIGCGLLLGLVPLGATPSNESVLLPPRAAVLLLVGVPGDLESENAYREQLQAWLQIAAASTLVQRVFVLCDNPDTVTFPAKAAAEAIKGDRNHFLGLARTLAGATNPLVVIAWGHGGWQRATPVFHVRGPRLTPSDFATLAEQVGPVTTHWVLLFRGSGAFARQLAGPGRQILASDSDTAFTSDPISMPLLLKLAQGNGASSFEALAEKFGRATAAWYSERNLARTEEPSLWLAGTQPRLLAPAAESEVVSAAPASPPSDSTNSAPEGVVASEPLRGERAAYWQEIHRIQPSQYPEADAVILRQRLNCALATNPAISTEQEEFIQILSPEGKQFGDFDISYSPPHEDIMFLDCEVLGPDGKVARLDPDAISEAGERSVGDYQLGRRKFFSLPGVVPGAVLHVRYRTTWKDFPLPHISMEIPLAKDLPVLEASVQVSVPKTSAFHFAFEGLSAPDP